jgi:septation ring formation regulator EzrA
MLPFLRDYSRKMQIPLRTEFYAGFCRSLIRTKNFAKLEVIANAILAEIRPRPFKLDSSMGNLKSDQVTVLEKEWKVREQENYLRLYIELIEVIVRSLETTVPAYLADLFDDYRRMKPAFNEKELGYAFVCFALKRDKVEELLVRLDA